MGQGQHPSPCPPCAAHPQPHLCEFSRELVKQRILEKPRCRTRCRTTKGLARRRQGT